MLDAADMSGKHWILLEASGKLAGTWSGASARGSKWLAGSFPLPSLTAVNGAVHFQCPCKLESMSLP